eukprot:TRINITY_DN7041_c0_g2_i1.p1 TRINITY_DN7041_c0_g2~~TRINITY_DN7041_c0_g2_i1.p1  ORF type:complete len:350 (+),score=39.13 TRINITY_DN7041_c0_g2_i1:55-1104(+)
MTDVPCQRCGALVPPDNMALHLLRCTGSSPPALAPTMPESRSPVEAQAGENSTWACAVCTLVNPATKLECEACEMPRGSQPGGGARARDVNEAVGDSTWSCQVCTFENLATDDVCESCGTERSASGTHSQGRRNVARRHMDSSRRSDDLGNGFGAVAGAIGGALMGGMLTAEVGQSQGRGRGRTRAGAADVFGGAALGAVVGSLLGSLAETEIDASSSSGARLAGARGAERIHAGPQRTSRRGARGGYRSENMDILLQHLAQIDHGDQSSMQPATAGWIEALPTHRVTAEDIVGFASSEQSTCTICMEEYKAGDVQKTLPCIHRFHAACIDPWLQRQGECPVCKHRVDG